MHRWPAERTAFARHLRRHLTDAERALWRALRGEQLGVKFRRQHPIGRYTVDFVCLSHRLVVELDGGQHAQSARDRHRDAWLAQQGYRVLRYWNHDVLTHLNGVLLHLSAALAPREDTPS